MSEQNPTQEHADAASTNPDALITDLDVTLTEAATDQVRGGEAYVNRVKTSDKQQKAVLDFVKG
jgi:hypothetical protein